MQIFAFSFQNHFFLLFGWQQMFVDARKEVLYFIYFAFFYLYRNSKQTQSTIVSMFFLPFDRKRKPYDNSATTTVTKQFWKHNCVAVSHFKQPSQHVFDSHKLCLAKSTKSAVKENGTKSAVKENGTKSAVKENRYADEKRQQHLHSHWTNQYIIRSLFMPKYCTEYNSILNVILRTHDVYVTACAESYLLQFMVK